MSNTQENLNSLKSIESPGYTELKEEEEPSTSEMSGDRPQKRSGRRPGRRSSKMDVRAKLERSRQSARECRARKKLRYQYLEDLVANREKAVFALRDELEMYKQWCLQLDQGQVPLPLLKAAEEDVASSIESMETRLGSAAYSDMTASAASCSSRTYTSCGEDTPVTFTKCQFQNTNGIGQLRGGNCDKQMEILKESSRGSNCENQVEMLKGSNNHSGVDTIDRNNEKLLDILQEIEMIKREQETLETSDFQNRATGYGLESANGITAQNYNSNDDITWDFVFEGDILKVVPVSKSEKRTSFGGLTTITEENEN